MTDGALGSPDNPELGFRSPRPAHALRCSGGCGRWVVTGYVLPMENRFLCARCAKRVSTEFASKS